MTERTGRGGGGGGASGRGGRDGDGSRGGGGPALPSGVRRLLRLQRADRDLDEELSHHFELSVAELMAAGLTRAEAEREARRRFGDEAQYRRALASIDRGRESRARWRRRFAAAVEVAGDGVRGVRRAPGLSAAIVLVFALGLGANATMLRTLDRLFFSAPAHIAAPDEVRRLYSDRTTQTAGRVLTDFMSHGDYLDLSEAVGFAAVAAVVRRELTLGNGPAARKVDAEFASASYWNVLGTSPAIGRFFDAAEDAPGAPRVVVVSHGFWQRELGGARDAIGRTLDLEDGAYAVIGVAPAGFTGADPGHVDLWLPLHAGTGILGERWVGERWGFFNRIFARLAPGVEAAAAQAEATALHLAGRQEQIERGMWESNAVVLVAPLLRAHGPEPAPEAAVATWLAAVALLVLLIACMNVANLLLARAVRRRRENGIRLALGVSRARLIGQVVVEGVVLALAGGAAALLVDAVLGDVVRRTLLPDVAWHGALPGAPLSALVMLAALLAGVAAALLPAVQTSRREVGDALRIGAGGVARSATRTRATLVAVQAALCVVLLFGAGLFVRSLEQVRALDLGFARDEVVLVRLETAPGALPAAELDALHRTAAARIALLPGVRATAEASAAPFAGWAMVPIRVEGEERFDARPSAPGGGPYMTLVGDGFFAAVGMRIMHGRPLGAVDVAGAERATVINRTMASMYFPAGDALGHCLYVPRTSDECIRIVGVVEDARRHGLREPDAPHYYVTLAQRPVDQWGAALVAVRTTGAPSALVPLLRREMHALEPRLRYVEVTPLRDVIAPQTRSWQLGATLFSAFGLLALIVAAVGLYAVLAFDVAERTRELGLRAALGARRHVLLRLVLGRALRITALGVTLGAAVALALAPRVEELLFDVPARDAATLAAVAAALLFVALIAAGLPAHRAARVDPNVALRAE